MELPDPPEGWTLKSLIEIHSNQWSCHLWGPEAYVYGYGSTARYATLDALKRIGDGDYFERLSGMRKSTVNVEALIKEITNEVANEVASSNRDSQRRF